MFYVWRQLWKNTDIGATVYVGEPLDNGVFALFPQPAAVPDRVRAQWDITVRY